MVIIHFYSIQFSTVNVLGCAGIQVSMRWHVAAAVREFRVPPAQGNLQ